MSDLSNDILAQQEWITAITRWKRSNNVNLPLDLSNRHFTEPINRDTWNLLPSTVTFLDIHNSNIIHVPSLEHIQDLQLLNVSMNPLIELPDALNQVQMFNCDSCNLYQLPQLANITNLYCDNNKLSRLDGIGNQLIYLSCQNNEITRIPDNLEQLETLICDNNQLQYIPSGLDNILKISIQFNQLTDVPIYLRHVGIVELYVYGNRIENCRMYSSWQEPFDTMCELYQPAPVINNDASIIDITSLLHPIPEVINSGILHPNPEVIFSTLEIDNIKTTCSNEDDYFTLEPLQPGNGFNAIMSQDSDYIECYVRSQLFESWDISQEELNNPEGKRQLYKYHNNKIDYAQPVYKLPYRNVWIDKASVVMLKIFRCLVLHKESPSRIYSEFGVSRIHGTEMYDIYTLRPCSYATWLRHDIQSCRNESQRTWWRPDVQDIQPTLISNYDTFTLNNSTYYGTVIDGKLTGYGMRYNPDSLFIGTWNKNVFLHGVFWLNDGSGKFINIPN